jgi:hypothetical protein
VFIKRNNSDHNIFGKSFGTANPKSNAMKTNLFTLILSGIIFFHANAQVVIRQTFITTTVHLNPWEQPCQPIYRTPFPLQNYPVVAAPGLTHRNHPECMNPEQFSRVLRMISSQNFESTRLQVANQVAASNALSSQQVTAIMHVFAFESTRLEFARNTYHRVTDPQNYYLVNNAFRFSSSIDELYNFIM